MFNSAIIIIIIIIIFYLCLGTKAQTKRFHIDPDKYIYIHIRKFEVNIKER